LGKIIRIDVDHGYPYAIPADYTFTTGRKEIWALGMRMPWRISFDSETHELFCGDVGQDKYEEVDIIEKGKNYGWRAMEGFHIYDSTTYNKGAGYTLPLVEYKHPEGVSITGGFVYRGKQYPAMNGIYVFGDWAFKLFYMQKDAGGKWTKYDCRFPDKNDNTFKFRINSFGVDEDGELYAVTQDSVGAISPTGVIYKVGLANSSAAHH
jgi:glucose/arabinose dehydrogenase